MDHRTAAAIRSIRLRMEQYERISNDLGRSTETVMARNHLQGLREAVAAIGGAHGITGPEIVEETLDKAERVLWARANRIAREATR